MSLVSTGVLGAFGKCPGVLGVIRDSKMGKQPFMVEPFITWHIVSYNIITVTLASLFLQAPAGSSAQCLKADWIWDSLKQKKQVSVERYLLS